MMTVLLLCTGHSLNINKPIIKNPMQWDSRINKKKFIE